MYGRAHTKKKLRHSQIMFSSASRGDILGPAPGECNCAANTKLQNLCSEELAGRPRALLAPTPLAPAPLVDSNNQRQETSFPAEKFRTFVLKFRWVVQERVLGSGWRRLTLSPGRTAHAPSTMTMKVESTDQKRKKVVQNRAWWRKGVGGLFNTCSGDSKLQ